MILMGIPPAIDNNHGTQASIVEFRITAIQPHPVKGIVLHTSSEVGVVKELLKIK